MSWIINLLRQWRRLPAQDRDDAITTMKALLRRNGRLLLHFGGRDTPILFWPFLVVVLLSGCALGALLGLAIILGTGDVRRGLTLVDQNIELIAAVIMGALVLLLASSVARRLTDGGYARVIGLLPVPFLVAGFTTNASFGRPPLTPLPDCIPADLINVGYFASLAILGVLLSTPTQRQP